MTEEVGIIGSINCSFTPRDAESPMETMWIASLQKRRVHLLVGIAACVLGGILLCAFPPAAISALVLKILVIACLGGSAAFGWGYHVHRWHRRVDALNEKMNNPCTEDIPKLEEEAVDLYNSIVVQQSHDDRLIRKANDMLARLILLMPTLPAAIENQPVPA